MSQLVGVLLPEEDAIDSGGSVARWVQSVYCQPRLSDLQLRVVGRIWGTGIPYRLPAEPVLVSSASYRLSRGLARLDVRLDGWLYCLLAARSLKTCDVVHIHGRPHYAIILRQLGVRAKLLVHSHRDESASSAQFLGRVAELADRIVFCSRAQRDRTVAKCGRVEEKSCVVYNGSDPQVFRPSDGVKDLATILFIGNLEEYKGIHLLLDAYEKTNAGRGTVSLRIVARYAEGQSGRGALARMDKLNEKGADIRYLGALTHEGGLPELLARSTVLCVPSLSEEAFPLVVLEGMLSKTLVVATRSGGIVEALGSDGILTEKNAESLAEGLTRALFEPESRRAFEERAYRRALDNFTWEETAENMRGVIDAL